MEGEKVYIMIKASVGNGKSHGLFYFDATKRANDVFVIDTIRIENCASCLRKFVDNLNKGFASMHRNEKIFIESKSLNSTQLAQEIFDCKYTNGDYIEKVERDISIGGEYINLMSMKLSTVLLISPEEIEKIYNRGLNPNMGLEMWFYTLEIEYYV